MLKERVMSPESVRPRNLSGGSSTIAAVLEATRQAVARTAGLLASLPEPRWTAPACGTWSVDQTAAHLAIGPIAYLEIVDQILAGGQEPLFDVTDPEFAEAQLIMFGEASPQERVEALNGSFGQFVAAAQQVPESVADRPTWTPEGVMPAAAALGIGLNELTVHEFDIRTAAGLPVDVAYPWAAALGPFAMHALAGLISEGGWHPLELAVEGCPLMLLSWGGRSAELRTSLPHESDPMAALACDAAVLALLTWGRMSLEEAASAGLATVAGHRRNVDAVFAACTSF